MIESSLISQHAITRRNHQRTEASLISYFAFSNFILNTIMSSSSNITIILYKDGVPLHCDEGCVETKYQFSSITQDAFCWQLSINDNRNGITKFCDAHPWLPANTIKYSKDGISDVAIEGQSSFTFRHRQQHVDFRSIWISIFFLLFITLPEGGK